MSRQKRRGKTYRANRRDRLVAQIRVVVVPALVLALAAGGYLLFRWLGPGASSAGAPTSGVPVLTVSPRVFDLGQVSQAAGRVTVRLALSNTGTADLVITEMETSCGCTRAALVVDGRVGPWFGMRGHGAWPVGWSARLRPGQEATLLVEYDPDAHGIYRGPIDRAVLIHSNDPRQPHAEVRLAGVQVP